MLNFSKKKKKTRCIKPTSRVAAAPITLIAICYSLNSSLLSAHSKLINFVSNKLKQKWYVVQILCVSAYVYIYVLTSNAEMYLKRSKHSSSSCFSWMTTIANSPTIPTVFSTCNQ